MADEIQWNTEELFEKFFRQAPQVIPEESVKVSERIKNLFIQWYGGTSSSEGGFTIYPSPGPISQAEFDELKAFAVIQTPYFPEWIKELICEGLQGDPRSWLLYSDITDPLADLLAQAATQNTSERLPQLVDLFLDRSTQKAGARAIVMSYRYLPNAQFHEVFGPWILAKPSAFPNFDGTLGWYDSPLLPIYKPVFMSERDTFHSTLLPAPSQRLLEYIYEWNRDVFESNRALMDSYYMKSYVPSEDTFGLISDVEFQELELYSIIQPNQLPNWAWQKALEIYKDDAASAGQYFELSVVISFVLAEAMTQDPAKYIPRVVELYRHLATRETAACAITLCYGDLQRDVFHTAFRHLILASPGDFSNFASSLDSAKDPLYAQYKKVFDTWRETPRTVSSSWNK